MEPIEVHTPGATHAEFADLWLTENPDAGHVWDDFDCSQSETSQSRKEKLRGLTQTLQQWTTSGSEMQFVEETEELLQAYADAYGRWQVGRPFTRDAVHQFVREVLGRLPPSEFDTIFEINVILTPWEGLQSGVWQKAAPIVKKFLR